MQKKNPSSDKLYFSRHQCKKSENSPVWQHWLSVRAGESVSVSGRGLEVGGFIVFADRPTVTNNPLIR